MRRKSAVLQYSSLVRNIKQEDFNARKTAISKSQCRDTNAQ